MTVASPDWIKAIKAGDTAEGRFAEIFPWAGDMIGCPHDPIYHGEGDPWVHTGMVVSELLKSEGYLSADEQVREILHFSAWLHDIAKPATTIIEYDEDLQRDRVRQPGHAPLGAMMAWQALIDGGYDPVMARDIHALVFWHQRPGHLVRFRPENENHGEEIRPNESNALKRIIQFGADTSHVTWNDLLTLCRADQLGRLTYGVQPSLDDLEYARMFVEDQGRIANVDLVRDRWTFGSPESRLNYMRSQGASGSPYHVPEHQTGSRVIILSGLPGSGKNTLIEREFGGWPTVSFDDIRDELRISNGDNQGKVIQAAYEKARTYLRSGEPFVWNATALSRRARQKIVGLALDYSAIVEIHSIDVPLETALRRNRGRGERAVPDKAMIDLARKREPAITDEAHRIFSYDADHNRRELLADRFGDPLGGLYPY